MQIKQEGTDVFLIDDNGNKQLIAPAFINFQLNISAAMEDGQIVSAAAALAVARAQRDYWQQLAERRGEELANLRGGQP